MSARKAAGDLYKTFGLTPPEPSPGEAGKVRWRDRPKEDDLDAIRRIVSETGVFNEEEIGIAVELAEERLSKGPDADYQFIFADMGGATIAYSCYGRVPFTDERFDLYWIASLPGTQRKGVASQLYSITEGAIKGLGGKKLYAETSSRDVYLPAQRFYERQGLKLEATLKDFYRDGDSKLIFGKIL